MHRQNDGFSQLPMIAILRCCVLWALKAFWSALKQIITKTISVTNYKKILLIKSYLSFQKHKTSESMTKAVCTLQSHKFTGCANWGFNAFPKAIIWTMNEWAQHLHSQLILSSFENVLKFFHESNSNKMKIELYSLKKGSFFTHSRSHCLCRSSDVSENNDA